jgi:hypothetical protein
MHTMVHRIRTLLSLAVVPAALAACSQDVPTQVRTVKMAIQATRIPGSENGGRPYATSLTQEVTHTPVWAGDPNGTGEALITVNLGQGEVCWETSASNIALPASASHIHRAVAGVRGPIVIALSPPGANGTATGCTTVADKALLEDILTSPEEFYVNVHTSEFPAGAVRGQLR